MHSSSSTISGSLAGSSTSLHHEQQIRVRLLNRLGIHKKEPNFATMAGQRRKHSIHGGCKLSSRPFCQPLKDDDGSGFEQQQGSIETASTTTTPPSNKDKRNNNLRSLSSCELAQGQDHERFQQHHQRRIQFNSHVMVVPIPSRHSYSKRIKQTFWMDGAEIQETAERNRYEFASEGWDFHQVLEDEDMYVDAMTGQLVHPCWVEDEEDDCDYEGNVFMGMYSNSHLPHSWSMMIDGPQEEAYLEVKAPTLKRTNSGVFELQALAKEEHNLSMDNRYEETR